MRIVCTITLLIRLNINLLKVFGSPSERLRADKGFYFITPPTILWVLIIFCYMKGNKTNNICKLQNYEFKAQCYDSIYK